MIYLAYTFAVIYVLGIGCVLAFARQFDLYIRRGRSPSRATWRSTLMGWGIIFLVAVFWLPIVLFFLVCSALPLRAGDEDVDEPVDADGNPLDFDVGDGK